MRNVLNALGIRQWLLIVLLFFFNITILGCLLLMITGRVVP